MSDAFLTCYDDSLPAVATLAGDFDAASPAETLRWLRAQWTTVAAALFWAADLERAELDKISDTGRLEAAALAAFDRWLLRRHAARPERRYERVPTGQITARARARHQVLESIARMYPTTRNRWRTDVMSTSLPEDACYDPTGAVGQDANVIMLRAMGLRADTAQRQRAFRADVAPSYFGSKHTVRPVRCEYPVVLSLGTYPYVYGSSLGAEPPGLTWATGRPWQPAHIALQIATRFWMPTANLTQDARVVAEQYKHFRKTTARYVDAVPTSSPTRRVFTRVYRSGPLLGSSGSLRFARVNGPRGGALGRGVQLRHAPLRVVLRGPSRVLAIVRPPVARGTNRRAHQPGPMCPRRDRADAAARRSLIALT